MSAPASKSAQRGIALVVVLLLLLIVTLIGLAGMRGTLLQERMAGNVFARGVAFQNAEAVLREAESFVALDPRMPADGDGCVAGFCETPDPAAEPRWLAKGFWKTPGNYRTSDLEGDGHEYRYMVEYMGLSKPKGGCTTAIDVSAGHMCAATVRNYRITAYSLLDNGAEVILQSMYQVE